METLCKKRLKLTISRSQLNQVEQLILNQEVGGSIPSGRIEGVITRKLENLYQGVCYVIAKRTINGKKKKGLVILGITEDGKFIVGNIFIRCESQGLPLEIALDILDEHNCVISWIDFYEDAMNARWSPETTLEKIRTALVDIKGREYAEQVILRLKHYMASKHKQSANSKGALV